MKNEMVNRTIWFSKSSQDCKSLDRKSVLTTICYWGWVDVRRLLRGDGLETLVFVKWLLWWMMMMDSISRVQGLLFVGMV